MPKKKNLKKQEKEQVKKELQKDKTFWQKNSITIYVLIGTLVLTALGMLERNRILMLIGGLGFLVLVIKLIFNDLLEEN